ncbi:MAG: DUF488 family protein [Dehalococcoidia bacterium]
MNPITFFGYQGRKVDDVVIEVLQRDAVLVDVRFSPHSRNPTWNRKTLESRLGPRHYLWMGDTLGNRLYKTDDIAIVDLAAGVDALVAAMQKAPILVMCVCPSPIGCHRTVIKEALQGHFGINAEEWTSELIP